MAGGNSKTLQLVNLKSAVLPITCLRLCPNPGFDRQGVGVGHFAFHRAKREIANGGTDDAIMGVAMES